MVLQALCRLWQIWLHLEHCSYMHTCCTTLRTRYTGLRPEFTSKAQSAAKNRSKTLSALLLRSLTCTVTKYLPKERYKGQIKNFCLRSQSSSLSLARTRVNIVFLQRNSSAHWTPMIQWYSNNLENKRALTKMDLPPTSLWLLTYCFFLRLRKEGWSWTATENQGEHPKLLVYARLLPVFSLPRVCVCVCPCARSASTRKDKWG